MSITISRKYTEDFIQHDELSRMGKKAIEDLKQLLNKTGKGNDYLGWIGLAANTPLSLVEEIEESVQKLQSLANTLVVIGIGGSYLGARAVIEALSPEFETASQNKVIFAGQHISEEYHKELLTYLDNKDYCLAVISKSGTTTEPAIAFRLLKKHLEAKYGKENAAQRIVAITDKEKGALKKLADSEGYQTFDIADDIGGRYSVLSPVGLLPIAFAGYSIKSLLLGAKKAETCYHNNFSDESNPVLQYATTRNLLHQKGYQVELLSSFNPRLFYFIEWWKQLYGESEGKDGKGLFPAGSIFSTDLHSLGQYIQDGKRILFETMISVDKVGCNLTVPYSSENIDGLNYLADKNLHNINKKAEEATIAAHHEGRVPVLTIHILELNEENLGQLIYFFELACGLSGYLLDVNPFDQPGVEAYKRNMFTLLGKPGY
jgi:glucose-6-phosphate isomerase